MAVGGGIGGVHGAGVAISGDPSLEALKDPAQRQAVLALAQALGGGGGSTGTEGRADDEEEDSVGLYDDMGTLVRYLRARNWDILAAESLIRSTARWRKAFRWRELRSRSGADAAMVRRENSQAKLYVRGYDRRGRPVIYMKPGNDDYADPQASVRHLVYNMERAVGCLERQAARGRLQGDIDDSSSRKVVLIIDFANTSLLNPPKLSVARESLYILQDHYPERLGQAFIIDAPWVMSAFFNTIWPFIDPVTREKVHFVSEEGLARTEHLSRYFDLAELEPQVCGTAVEPFQSPVYLRRPSSAEASSSENEFGFEFNEQLRLSGGGSRASRAKAGDGVEKVPHDGALLAPLSVTFSDPRVLALPREERALLRNLAKALAEGGHAERREDAAGLYDDAGSLLRYLRSEAWDPARAEARLRRTARWRKEFGLGALLAGVPRCGGGAGAAGGTKALEREHREGRLLPRGSDLLGRPVLVAKLDTALSLSHEEMVRFVVTCIEKVAACADRNQAKTADGSFTLLVDFHGYAPRNRPRISTLCAVARIWQDHYPERLGSAVMINPPAKVVALWRAMERLVLKPSMSAKVRCAYCDPGEFPSEQLAGLFDRETWLRALDGGTASNGDALETGRPSSRQNDHAEMMS